MNMFLPLNPAFVLLLAIVFGLMWFVHPKKPYVVFANAGCWLFYSIYLLAFPATTFEPRWDLSVFHAFLLATTLLSAFHTIKFFCHPEGRLP